MIALSFNTLSVFSGGFISLFTSRVETAPWILALFPPILTIRGDISGIFSGNLTTMLHLGIIRPQIRDNTENYRRLISAVLVITYIDTLAMGSISFILNLILRRVDVWQLYIFAFVPTVSCTIAVAISIPLTSIIAITAYRRGLNPDIVVYPILASVNDIIVAASFVMISLLVIVGGFTVYLLSITFIAISFFCLWILWRNKSFEFFFKTIKEGTGAAIMSSFFGSLNGILLSGITKSLQVNPGLIILYPALTNMLGNIGSIIGSITTTSLALGYVRSFAEQMKESLRKIFQVEIASAVMHFTVALISYFMVKPIHQEADLRFLIGVALFSNLSSFLFISVFALVVAFFSFKRGLNPDNVTIPAITSTSDSVATLVIIPAIAFLRLIGLQ